MPTSLRNTSLTCWQGRYMYYDTPVVIFYFFVESSDSHLPGSWNYGYWNERSYVRLILYI